MISLESLPDLITSEEIAQYLGVDVVTVRNYINREVNPLPAIMISPKIIRVNKETFIEWLENNAKEVNK